MVTIEEQIYGEKPKEEVITKPKVQQPPPKVAKQPPPPTGVPQYTTSSYQQQLSDPSYKKEYDNAGNLIRLYQPKSFTNPNNQQVINYNAHEIRFDTRGRATIERTNKIQFKGGTRYKTVPLKITDYKNGYLAVVESYRQSKSGSSSTETRYPYPETRAGGAVQTDTSPTTRVQDGAEFQMDTRTTETEAQRQTRLEAERITRGKTLLSEAKTDVEKQSIRQRYGLATEYKVDGKLTGYKPPTTYSLGGLPVSKKFAEKYGKSIAQLEKEQKAYEAEQQKIFKESYGTLLKEEVEYRGLTKKQRLKKVTDIILQPITPTTPLFSNIIKGAKAYFSPVERADITLKKEETVTKLKEYEVLPKISYKELVSGVKKAETYLSTKTKGLIPAKPLTIKESQRLGKGVDIRRIGEKISQGAEWYAGKVEKVKETLPPIKIFPPSPFKRLEVKHITPKESAKMIRAGGEFAYGTTEGFVAGLREKPLKTALTTATFFVLPPVIKGAGKVWKAGVTASKVTKIPGVTRAGQITEKGITYGLPAVYGASIYGRLAGKEAREAGRTFGEIISTEVVPMVVGTGAWIGLSKIRASTVPIKITEIKAGKGVQMATESRAVTLQKQRVKFKVGHIFKSTKDVKIKAVTISKQVTEKQIAEITAGEFKIGGVKKPDRFGEIATTGIEGDRFGTFGKVFFKPKKKVLEFDTATVGTTLAEIEGRRIYGTISGLRKVKGKPVSLSAEKIIEISKEITPQAEITRFVTVGLGAKKTTKIPTFSLKKLSIPKGKRAQVQVTKPIQIEEPVRLFEELPPRHLETPRIKSPTRTALARARPAIEKRLRMLEKERLKPTLSSIMKSTASLARFTKLTLTTQAIKPITLTGTKVQTIQAQVVLQKQKPITLKKTKLIQKPILRRAIMPRLPFIPTPPPPPPPPPIIPLLKLPRKSKQIKKKLKIRKLNVYFPDFTAKTLYNQGIKATRLQKLKLLKRTFTGAEIRRGIDIT